jgi:hypothetical protein
MASYDPAFMSVLQQHSSLSDFLDTFFGFMSRKTDLFESLSRDKGFNEGEAEKIVLAAFRKRMTLHKESHSSSSGPSPCVPPVTNSPQPRQPSSTSSTYNGGRTERYSWSQTLEEVTVEIPVPLNTKKASVHVEILPKQLSVRVGDFLVVQGSLAGAVNRTESTWTFSANVVTITLEKTTPTWWKTVLEGDSEIDTSKVDSTRKLTDLDDQTQAKIRQLMFDQQQKSRGLPTSEELLLERSLKAAWNAEDSPFKDTPFDASVIRPSNSL